jgi:DNA helicase II / ATP-dependent DNA helicase PcrA
VDVPDDRVRTSADSVLAALDPEQREVALTVRGPVCVLAGAGTGKTRAVAHRIAYAVATGVTDPARVLAVTFTTRAAGELRGRLRQLGSTAVASGGLEHVQARTFHAAALRQLSHFWPATVGGRPPQVLASKISLVAEAARRLRLSAGLPELRDAAAEIEWAKVSQVRPDAYEAVSAKAARTGPLAPVTTARLYAVYEELRRERHLVDFESVLELTAAILAEYPAAAATVRDRYSYFVVDEYQDVNPLQKLLLDTWIGDRDDLCVVGDPRQTIYSFAGATSGYLTGFPAEFPDATVIRLVRNYRSTPQVVALANRLDRGSGLDGGGGLVAQRPRDAEPEFTECGDEQEEAAVVARQAAAFIRAGTAPREIAVLVRINAQTAAFEQALSAAGVPFLVKGTERFFDRDEVRQAVALLRGAARSASPADRPSDQVRAVLSGIGLTSQPPGGHGQARERWESLQSLAQLADDFFAAAPQAALSDLSAELAQRSAAGHAPAMDGVTIASLHAAKGLEWDVVFLPGLTDGTVPIIYAQTEEAIEEERRLLYVGVTRARKRVQLSWALARSPGSRQTRKPSRFLSDIRPRPRLDTVRRARRGGAGPAGGPQAGGPQAGGPQAGGPQAAAGPLGIDDPLLARLRDWRLTAARDQSVPAYVIFKDATLEVIAERRPASLRELAAVPGVGRTKLDRYGAAVLALCAEAAPRAAG